MHLRHLSQRGSFLGRLNRLKSHSATDDAALPGSDGSHHGEQAGRAAEDRGSFLAAAAPSQSQSLGVSQGALSRPHDLNRDVRRLGGLGGTAGRGRRWEDGRGVPRRQLERQAESLQSFGLDGDGSVAVAGFFCTERCLLQRLHHQSLSVDRWFDGRRANRIPVRLGCCAGR